MNSDEHSLIEISAEDDSLLQQPLLDDFTLALSPLHLQIPKSSHSSINSSKGNTGREVHGRVSTYNNKENHGNNENKLGVPNLSVEPQKMKKSKKAGGYNLRKSLAWDRAFLTEEGVLNDSELSMITGTIGDRDSLSVIGEQGRDSLPMNSGSANLETLEKDIYKEFPSGYPNKRSATRSPLMKRDSLSDCCLASASKSAQKILSPGQGLKKGLCKGEAYSSPMVSVSQKRLSNSGTKHILTRNSKIPKIPVSKKNPSVPSVATTHNAAGGSSLKGTGIYQPGARKSLSSNLLSKSKHASNAGKASLESVPKSNKPSADLRNDVKTSALRRHSLNHRAQHTTKVNKYSESSSSQGLLRSGTDMVKSSDESSSTIAFSHVPYGSSVSDSKKFQVQGVKPSGLRMPSPSLRFFSETKAPVSNNLTQVNSMPPNLLKSSISTSRNAEVAVRNHDFRPTQLLNGASEVDAMGKAGLCSQKTDKCSTSLSVAPKVLANVIQEKCNQQAVEVRVPIVDKNSEATNNKQFRIHNLDEFEKQYKDQVPISLEVEEKDSQHNKSMHLQVEFEQSCYKETTVFQENRTANQRMLDEPGECPDVRVSKVCEITTEAQSQFYEDVELNLSVQNNDAISESQFILNIHHNNMMVAPDSSPSSSILDDNRTPRDSNSCGLDQYDSQRNMKVDERNLLANEKSSTKLDEDGSDVPICTSGVMAGQDIIISDGICNANCNVAGGSKHKHVDGDEQDEAMLDCKASTQKLSESSEMQDEATENHDMPQKNSANSGNYDTRDIFTVNLDVVELSSHCALTSPELLNGVPVEFYHLCDSDQGEGQSHSRHGVSDNCTSVHGAPIANIQCTEITEDTFAEADKHQVLSNKLVAKEMSYLSNEADSNYSIKSQNSFDKNSQVNNSTKEVNDQIDLLGCLPKNGHDYTLQTTHLTFQSSGIGNQDQVALAVANLGPEESLCPVNKQEISPQGSLMRSTVDECIKSDKSGYSFSPREARMQISQHVDGLSDESTSNTEGIDDKDAITKQRTDDLKLTRLPPNVVPFSDEWLAALETAGEEILTMKTGAVKHSPPDKSTLEPGPWSPVKRKTNQVIGPFDCTKYTNTQPDNIN